MKWNVGIKIGLGFSLAILVFILVGIVAYRSTDQLIESTNQVTHIYDTASDIDDSLAYITDIETGERGFLLTGDEIYLHPYQNGVEKIGGILESLKKHTAENANQQEHAIQLESLIKERIKLAAQAIETRRTGTPEAVTQFLKTGNDKERMDAVRQVIAKMQADEDVILKTRLTNEQANADRTKFIIAVGTILAAVLGVIASLVITRNIAHPLQDLTATAERISSGDLNTKSTVLAREDEVGQLSRAFDKMGGDLRGQIGQLIDGVNVLSTAAAEIVASTAQFAATANQSAAAVTETTATVEEVRQTAQLATQKSKYVSDSAQKAAHISQNGRKSTDEAGSGMTRIRLQMEAIATSMMQLSEQSQAIGQIMAVVEDLASQSTLLAVNAAIEAAKAGEHGKGFTVVAQEVKSLAEQSRAATNQVRTILGDIQKATTAAVLSTEQGSKAVEAGERQTSVAGESIQALADSVNEAAQAATQIAASSQQQLVGVDQVAVAMESIKQASTQNVASAGQLEASARNLNDLGQRLKQTIARYRI